jgi:hypothetical protein
MSIRRMMRNVGTPPEPYFFDIFSDDEGGWSFRQLSASHTICCTVVRDSDSAELDIGFIDREVDEAAIASFCGASIGRIKRWYNGNPARTNLITQSAVVSSMPRIYNGSSVIKRGGKVAIDFNANPSAMIDETPIIIDAEPVSYFTVTDILIWDGNGRNVFRHEGGTATFKNLVVGLNENQFGYFNTPYVEVQGVTGRFQYYCGHYSGNDWLIRKSNGISNSNGSGPSDSGYYNSFLVSSTSSTFNLRGYMHEFIVFGDGKIAGNEYLTISQNQIDYWGI